MKKEINFVDIAVPLPLAMPLTYSVPSSYSALAAPGVRARVRVGQRRLVGIIIAHRQAPPEGVKVRSVESVLDLEPVITEELLELAKQAAEYYLAPIGEVLRSMIPADLPLWGDQKIWVTNAGVMLSPGTPDQKQVVEHLSSRGRVKISDLVQNVNSPGVLEAIEKLRESGRVQVASGREGGGRYLTGVELASGELDELIERSGRSKQGRAVVELLGTLGRPATVVEVCDAVECGPSVVRRLLDLGILRRFTQIAKLPLDRHRLKPRETKTIRLREDQENALRGIVDAVDAGGYAAFLLDGMTGSGKTEVYLRGIDRVIESGGSAIILVPEIALVPALAAAARDRYGSGTALLHSALSKSERHQEWERIRRGDARVVVGPRSAIFAPVPKLGLIVVDEEQDPSYKQDHVPRYNGRDLAILRAHQSKSVAVLVSATPSLETRRNSEIGKLQSLTLTSRVGQGSLPEGTLVDLRTEAPPSRPGEVHFTEPLKTMIESALSAGDQIILLRNRRGYAPVLLCRACGHDFRCDACGLPRTLHLKENRLRCHYCGAVETKPHNCPECSEDALEAIGAGTERVEEKFRELFPGVGVGVLDRDVTRRGQATNVLERFGQGETQVLVGTQMVSKGHHFPGVALTAVLLADTYLGFPDFRAVERTYNLLTQLAGRAGRGDRPGKVVIQTYHPEHYAIQAALEHDDARFAHEEMKFRRMFHYPPYTRMVQLLLRDSNRARAEETMSNIVRALEAHPLAAGVRVSGPAPAPFERLRGKWRFQALLRHTSGNRMRELLRKALPKSSSGELVVDVDPYEML